ncbi:MAG: L,D-transpeptidase [Chloroflexi bacterium]|nr:L,D-transpeptidase [Chloroflexota bacterium]
MKNLLRMGVFLMVLLITVFGYVERPVEAIIHPPTAELYTDMQDCQLGGPGENIGVNMGIVGGYEFFRVKTAPANVYDGAYGGNDILYTFQEGYHFITPRQKIGDWYEINVGEWMHGSHLEQVDPSYFSGVAMTGYPGYAFGWILQNHYASASPGGEPVQTPEYRIYRYTRITVCATQAAGGWNWYLVGPNIWVVQTRVGLVKPAPNPGGVGGRWVAVDLYEQVLTAYEGGNMVFATLVSSGLPGWDTNPGVFQVWGRNINAPMSGAEGREDAYRLENVPYAMYFDGEISLHGTYWHNGFGYRQSHGCVNLSISDAAWVWSWLGSGSVYVYYSASY